MYFFFYVRSVPKSSTVAEVFIICTGKRKSRRWKRGRGHDTMEIEVKLNAALTFELTPERTTVSAGDNVSHWPLSKMPTRLSASLSVSDCINVRQLQRRSLLPNDWFISGHAIHESNAKRKEKKVMTPVGCLWSHRRVGQTVSGFNPSLSQF